MCTNKLAKDYISYVNETNFDGTKFIVPQSRCNLQLNELTQVIIIIIIIIIKLKGVRINTGKAARHIGFSAHVMPYFDKGESAVKRVLGD
jgi:hypothetical protein